MPVFEGLSKKLPACLQALGRNNCREWFHAHREDYQRHVIAPLAALAEALAPGMALLDGAIAMRLSRPNRDIRFSKDKTPYRTEAWFAFRRLQSDWLGYPAFFFETTPEYCRCGMGYYAARPATMAALRGIAQENPHRYLTAMAAAEARLFAAWRFVQKAAGHRRRHAGSNRRTEPPAQRVSVPDAGLRAVVVQQRLGRDARRRL